FLTSVLFGAHQARRGERIGALDVSHSDHARHSGHFQGPILERGTGLLITLYDQELIAVSHDLHRVLRILYVLPFSEELGPATATTRSHPCRTQQENNERADYAPGRHCDHEASLL